MYVTKLSHPNTILIKLSEHRFILFLFRAKKQLRLSDDETCNDLFIEENLSSLNYSLFRNLKSEKMRRNENKLANFEVVYAFQGNVFKKKERAVCCNGASYIPTNSSLQ